MKNKMTDEAIRTVINNAPEGAEYWISGYDVGYRKLVLDCVFGWLPDDGKWVRAIDNDIAMERVDKGFWIPNLIKELVDRQGKPIPQTKEVEWVNGDGCRYVNDIDHPYTYVGEHPHGDGHYVFSEEKGITYIANGYLLEPETQEDRERREREELFKVVISDIEDRDDMKSCNVSIDASFAIVTTVRAMLDAGYRKGD